MSSIYMALHNHPNREVVNKLFFELREGDSPVLDSFLQRIYLLPSLIL